MRPAAAQLIVGLVALSACSSTAAEGPPSASASAASETPGESTGPAPTVTCSPQLIRRAGLDTTSPRCAEGIARFEALPSADLACRTDADCGIYMAARGCLGVNVATGAHDRMQALDAECIADDCGTADFTDHRVACREGCCTIFEE